MRTTGAGLTLQAMALMQALCNGVVRVYEGGKPETPGSLAGRKPLVTLQLPSEGSAVLGVVVFGPTAPSVVELTGRPTWYEAVAANGEVLADGSVGADASSDMVLPTLKEQATIYAGMRFALDGFELKIVALQQGE